MKKNTNLESKAKEIEKEFNKIKIEKFSKNWQGIKKIEKKEVKKEVKIEYDFDLVKETFLKNFPIIEEEGTISNFISHLLNTYSDIIMNFDINKVKHFQFMIYCYYYVKNDISYYLGDMQTFKEFCIDGLNLPFIKRIIWHESCEISTMILPQHEDIRNKYFNNLMNFIIKANDYFAGYFNRAIYKINKWYDNIDINIFTGPLDLYPGSKKKINSFQNLIDSFKTDNDSDNDSDDYSDNNSDEINSGIILNNICIKMEDLPDTDGFKVYL